MIDQRKRIFAISFWTLDLAITAVSFFLAYGVRSLLGSLFVLEGHSVLPLQEYLWLLAVILPTWAILLPAFQVYSLPTLEPLSLIRRLTKAVFVAWLAALAIQSFVRPEAPARLLILFTLAINYILLVSVRALPGRFRTASTERHIAVIGDGERAHEFAQKLQDNVPWGLKCLGVFPLNDARTILEKGGIDEIAIVAAAGPENRTEFTEIFRLCEELGVTASFVIDTASFVLDLFPESAERMEFHRLDQFPVISFTNAPTHEGLLLAKRIIDLAITTVFGIGAAILIGASAIAVRLTSSGPAFFKQQRCGLNGRTFTMYKLRSMVDNAEQLRVEMERFNEMDGPVFKSSRDPRITPVGRILRKFSIDEAPQLYNVLRGDMSLVGPRPPLPEEVAHYERWQRRRLSMKPGLTCLWQISGRSQVNFQDWMKLDLRYIDNWSLLLDLKILLKTVPVVLLGRGAK